MSLFAAGRQNSRAVVFVPSRRRTKMSRPKSVILFFLTLSTLSFVDNASAQAVAENHWEAYAMASSISGGAVTPSSARGFRIGGAWRPGQYLSLVADSGHYFDSVGNGPITLMA